MSNSQTDENNRTTYARAVLEYDKQHEDELLSAITKAIVDTSMVSDCNAAVIRTGEIVEALVTVLVSVLAMSPSVSRSPTAIRKTVDDLDKRLRSRIAAAENNADLQGFIRRMFRGTDVEGNA
jgi:hypothetical protein